MLLLKKILTFLYTDIWRIRAKDIPKAKSFFLKQLRIIILSVKGFKDDECSLKSSALTFYTLLSIVPVLAMAFGIAKGFGFNKLLEEEILHNLPGQEQVLLKIIEFAHSLLENTQGGIMAGIGVIVLFSTVITMLGNIESSFNHIWGIKKSRDFSRKFSDYLSIMLICPVLLIIASSLNISGVVQSLFIKSSFLNTFTPFILKLLKFIPFVFIWIMFSFIYIFMPNTKVNLSSGLIAGIIAGTTYQFVQWSYIIFQIGVAKYNAIYGSFAALPLFLIWLQMSWYIVLLGAEISFAHQNVETYEFEPDCLQVSLSFKKLLSLTIMHLIVKNFQADQKSKLHLSADTISHTLDIPIRLVRQIIFELSEGKLISEITDKEGNDKEYQPACSIETISIKKVLDTLDERGSNNIPIAQTKEYTAICQALQKINNILQTSEENILLRNI